MNKLNKSILCDPLARMVLFYSTSSINLAVNLHEFNILFITYTPKELFLTLCLYSENDVTSKCYYTSVISFLLNGFITLLLRVICDNLKYYRDMVYLYCMNNVEKEFCKSSVPYVVDEANIFFGNTALLVTSIIINVLIQK